MEIPASHREPRSSSWSASIGAASIGAACIVVATHPAEGGVRRHEHRRYPGVTPVAIREKLDLTWSLTTIHHRHRHHHHHPQLISLDVRLESAMPRG